MSRRILAIDVGGGTQDILIYDESQPVENNYKMILPSQTTVLARKIKKLTKEKKGLFLAGHLMGGGPCVRALKLHLSRKLPVYSTPQAAKTIKDSLGKVEKMGVVLRDEPPEGVVSLFLGDVNLKALQNIMDDFEIEMPDKLAVAVQDHGESPDMSNRLFRFKHWENFIKEGGNLKDLAYYQQVPPYLTRMNSVQQLIPGSLLMDTCAAAVWGALEDGYVASYRDKGLILVNLGNQHTLAVLLKGSRIYGLFEHHTGIMAPSELSYFLKKLKEGTLTHEEVFDSGGHGCYISEDYEGSFDFTAVTGPQRHLAQELGYYQAAPYGDMMLSGCFGLVAAFIALEKDN
ncbi:MAG: pyruvate formate lyase-activating protein [Candidatus Syntrophonatronum acetioxidans]|uniref:Pyruvate formate lyase-activating protein n=1 Tax=Candidatus Syntrophonatronum acetioxidans TaxID=1795816 RepID=A0A424YFF8_9FIRM|nr:MAG: pyruvate formate lyase-activating protein [Candidatus Syntrophonatronum acetioxidans]